MNCFSYTVSKKKFREIAKENSTIIPVYRTELLPAEGDRVIFENFAEVYAVTKVSEVEDDAALCEAHGIDEFTEPYFLGFFELMLCPLYDRFTIVSLRNLIEREEYLEIGPTAGDICNLVAKFDVELKVAEAESEGKGKVSDALREKLIEEAEEESVRTFWSTIHPAVFDPVADYKTRHFQVSYSPFIAYGENYAPIAVMLYYCEHDLETGEESEMIPVAYVDPEVVDDEFLVTEDVQYIVEQLFAEVMRSFRPDSSESLLNNPTITIPVDQVEYYEGLIEAYNWKADEVTGFGYRIFN